MPDELQPSEQTQQARASLQLAFSVIGQIGGLTLGIIVVALVGGLWLDKTFSTRPLFTLLFMGASFPVTYYIIYRIALRAVSQIQPAAGQPSPRSKEDRQHDDNA